MDIVVIGLFVAVAGLGLVNQSAGIFPAQGWLNAAVVIIAFCASVCAMPPTLARTNVLMAGGLAAFIGGFAHAVNAAMGMPFGRGEFTPAAGPSILGLIPWWLPVIWTVITLAARGTARLFLHRSQAHPFHGFRVIALAGGLATLSFVGIQLLEMRAGLYSGNPTFLLSSVSGLVLQVVIQVAVTPLLLDKFPGKRPTNYRPLLVWCVWNGALVMEIFMAARGN